MSKAIALTSMDRCAGCHHLEKGDPVGNVMWCHCSAHFPHVEPPTDCARDEITEWVASHYAGADLEEAVAFLLAWANRRAANVIGHAVEALAFIAVEAGVYDGTPEMDEIARAAQRALRFVGPRKP